MGSAVKWALSLDSQTFWQLLGLRFESSTPDQGPSQPHLPGPPPPEDDAGWLCFSCLLTQALGLEEGRTKGMYFIFLVGDRPGNFRVSGR